MCMGILPTCTSVHPLSIYCPQRPEEGAESSGTGVSNGCEPPCGPWELNPGPLEEQQPVLSITEHSLQPHSAFSHGERQGQDLGLCHVKTTCDVGNIILLPFGQGLFFYPLHSSTLISTWGHVGQLPLHTLTLLAGNKGI